MGGGELARFEVTIKDGENTTKRCDEDSMCCAIAHAIADSATMPWRIARSIAAIVRFLDDWGVFPERSYNDPAEKEFIVSGISTADICDERDDANG